MNAIVVEPPVARIGRVNCCHVWVVVPPLFENKPAKTPLISTSTVLVVPNGPPGFDTFPTQNDRSYAVPADVATVCSTPSPAFELAPVKSSHCAPSCAGKEKPN